MTFWIGAAVLLLLAGSLVLWPLLRQQPRAGGSSRQETVRALYQDRLAEIAEEASAGQVNPEDLEVVEAELGSALLSDFREDELPASDWQGRPGFAFATAGLAVLLGLVVYLWVGDPDAEALRGAEIVLRLDPAADPDRLDSWRERLADRVEAKPDDAQSWYLLGHTDLKLEQYQLAAEAFARAHVLVGEDPSVDLYWLQARYLAADGQLDAASRAIAERVLAANPNQSMVLEILAVDAFRNGRYQQAVGMLNRAMARAGSAVQRAALRAGMAAAREKMGDLTPSLDVNVAVASSPPHGATLFVIARPVGGGMPYAVVRRPAVGFPLAIRLDDAVSMNPALGLSQAPVVEVVVRLSLSGAPMSHPGDWEWQSGVISLEDASTPISLAAELAPPTAES